MTLQRPEDLTALTPEQFAEWQAAITAAAAELSQAATAGRLTDDQLTQVHQLTEWSTEVRAESERRTEAAQGDTAQADALAALAQLTTAPAEAPPADNGDGGNGDGGSADVVAGAEAIAAEAATQVLTALAAAANRLPAAPPAAPPSVADLINAGAPTDGPDGGGHTVRRVPGMIAAADIGGGYTSGQVLEDRADLAGALMARLKSYGVSNRNTSHGPVLKLPTTELAAATVGRLGGELTLTGRSTLMTSPNRHGAARIMRDVSEEQFGGNDEANWNLMHSAAAEWRAQLSTGRLRALSGTVARSGLIAAWCARGENWFNLCNQASLDGQLPLPERTVDRGGIAIAEGGGFEFGTVYDLIGDNTATDAELTAGVVKTCVEVPCLDMPETRLNADWLCITASLLQRRAWPESIEAFIAMALAAKAHKTNSRIIAAIVAASGTPVEVASCTGADAFSTLYAAVDLAVQDLATRSYMAMGPEFEVVLPVWVRANLRAAVMNRRAIDDPVKADSWLQAQFAKLGVTVHFVYGYQDAHVTPAPAGFPGAATPIPALPTEVQFIIYPAGTWVKGTQPVIDLDTIYDSTLLASNQYTAVFVEDGWLALQTCPYSRVYNVTVDPCACGCDAGDQTSPTSP
jgi:hypothetical protein